MDLQKFNLYAVHIVHIDIKHPIIRHCTLPRSRKEAIFILSIQQETRQDYLCGKCNWMADNGI